MKGFTNENIKFDVLRQRAYNMRWAEQDADVIPLTAADHDFPCAPEVVQALQDYIKEGYFTYTPHRGFPSFKQAIAKAMKERKNEDVNPDFVLPIDSAARGMKVIADAVLQPTKLSCLTLWTSSSARAWSPPVQRSSSSRRTCRATA